MHCIHIASMLTSCVLCLLILHHGYERYYLWYLQLKKIILLIHRNVTSPSKGALLGRCIITRTTAVVTEYTFLSCVKHLKSIILSILA